ncbi:MAG: aminopeptidase P family protein [Coprobacter sp.]|nr:aminopeptidase P family protein [Coprobacter sp.]
MSSITSRIEALRQLMASESIDAFIIPSADPHQSEYPADHWKSRAWISGFTGSAGTVVITATDGGLWTDSRYFLQAEEELQGCGITLYKEGLPDTISLQEFIIDALPQGATVAIDGSLFSYAGGEGLKEFFTSKGFVFKTDFEPFHTIWADRPDIPGDPAFVYPEKYCGKSFAEKWEEVSAALEKEGANAIIVSALDELAWLLNIRGNDVLYNPVAVGFAYLSTKHQVLFMDAAKVTTEMADYLASNHIELVGYENIYDFLGRLTAEEIPFIDPGKVNYQLVNTIPADIKCVYGRSPITWIKSLKNDTEIAGRKAALTRDGVAMVEFLHWLDTHIGRDSITELDIAEKLREFRSRQALYVSESFGTIAGYQGHGAIVHYSATPESNSTLQPEGFVLVDSGAQYLDGTTDITRTIVLGPLTDEQKRDFTLVLKGHIGIATAIFPQGTRGDQLDVLARRHLWNNMRNYLHGTGHGVGHFLNVHEGPQNIRLEQNNTPLTPGMVTSNEPGVYVAGRYGIRTENLTLVAEAGESDFGKFLCFETLTLCPIDTRAIDRSLMTDDEIAWLNNYHATVYDRLSPSLSDDVKEWLRNATAAI